MKLVKNVKMNVAILMSTFNGSRYLREQIASLQHQTFSKWNLYIRDDGSADNTIEIIEKLAQSDNRIHLISDNKCRLRPMKSFLTLLKEVNADFYFFCDQDDFWKEDKLQLMLDRISKEDNTKPNLVYCNLQCVNSELKPIDNQFNYLVGQLSGYSRCVSNDMPGCVMLINKKLRDLTVTNTTEFSNILMHDWWIALIAQFCGKIFFLNKRLILYRQHGNNAIGAGKNGNIIKKIFRKGIIEKQQNLIIQTFLQIREFYKDYSSYFSKKDTEFFKKFILCKDKNAMYRLHFIIKNDVHSSYLLRTIVYDYFFSTKLKKLLNRANKDF